MRSAVGRGVLVGLLGVTVVAGCGMEDKHRPFFHDPNAEAPELSAARLGDGFDDDSAADFLRPEEREAVRRAGITDIHLSEAEDGSAPRIPEPATPKGPIGRAFDTAGKIGVALLGVGLTLGAAVAPFLLF